MSQYTTADFIKKVLSVHSHSMTTIYLSRSAQVDRRIFFMKSPVCQINKVCKIEKFKTWLTTRANWTLGVENCSTIHI